MHTSAVLLSLATLVVGQKINVYNAKDVGLSQHTIYMPESTPSGKIPVLLWASGGCMREGMSTALFTTLVADVIHSRTSNILKVAQHIAQPFERWLREEL